LIIVLEASPAYAYLLNEFIHSGNNTINYIKYKNLDAWKLYIGLNNLADSLKQQVHFVGINITNKYSRQDLIHYIEFLSDKYPEINSSLLRLTKKTRSRPLYHKVNRMYSDSVSMNSVKRILDSTDFNILKSEISGYLFGYKHSHMFFRSKRNYRLREEILFENLRTVIVSTKKDNTRYLALMGRVHVVKTITDIIGSEDWNSCINRIINSNTLSSDEILTVWIDYGGYLETLGMEDRFIYTDKPKNKTTMYDLQKSGIIDKVIKNDSVKKQLF
jgi:hypothetical protein